MKIVPNTVVYYYCIWYDFHCISLYYYKANTHKDRVECIELGTHLLLSIYNHMKTELSN